MHGVRNLWGWRIEKSWLLDYIKSKGYDFGVHEGAALAESVQILKVTVGIRTLTVMLSQEDPEDPVNGHIFILTLYTDEDVEYDVEAEKLITPDIPQEKIDELLRVTGKTGEEPRWWPYMFRQ